MELSLTLEQVIEFLLETPLFEDLDSVELGEVVRVMQIQRVRPEHTIFKEGDSGNAWYVIYEGEAEVEKRDTFGPKRRVATLGSHACFGEMAVLDDSPRSASVISRSEVTLFRFPSIPFQDLLEEGNLAAYKLVHAMARTLCVRQRRINQQLTDLIQESESDALGLRSRVGTILDASSISE